ncbi:MAG: N-acetylneuraminate synthase family protein [Solirubrobacterales bacterium]|nr:N-acetylneuraminate synthase family protein [Solirubrobacterales bacterium]
MTAARDAVGEVRVGDHAPIRRGACRVIAEAGVNHNNSVTRAIEMAQAAAGAGAWGIKFQLYKADSISVPDSPKYWEDEIGTGSQYEAFQKSDRLAYDAYGEVAAACAQLGIVFFATPFDLRAVDALERIGAPLYKIASGDLTHRPLLEAVAATDKPVLLSTGAATVAEIHDAIEWTGLGPEKLVLLVCTLTYPTPDEDGNFARLREFEREFAPYLSGVSDHTLGTAGAWMAAALGGVCIEKHYTLDRTLPDVPDHAISVQPEELAEMVAACDRAAVLRGRSWIGPRESELPARANARRSIVLERALEAGALIGEDDLGYKRPGDGIAPADARRLIGRRLLVARPAGGRLSWGDVEP